MIEIKGLIIISNLDRSIVTMYRGDDPNVFEVFGRKMEDFRLAELAKLAKERKRGIIDCW